MKTKIKIFTSINPKWYDTIKNDVTNILYNKFTRNVLNVRVVKVLSHKFVDTDISVWVDGNVILKDDFDPEEILGEYDMVLLEHPERDCIYEEYEEAKKRISTDIEGCEWIDEQIQRYRGDSFPEHQGLWFTTMIIRRENERVRRFNETWWSEISRYGYRDQISLPVVLANNPDLRLKTLRLEDYRLLNKNPARDNKYFVRPEHAAESMSVRKIMLYTKKRISNFLIKAIRFVKSETSL